MKRLGPVKILGETHAADHPVKKPHRLQEAIEGLCFHPTGAEHRTRHDPMDKEVAMNRPHTLPIAKTAVLTIAEIKAVIEAFDRGDSNVHDALDGIITALEARRSAVAEKPCRKRARRNAA